MRGSRVSGRACTTQQYRGIARPAALVTTACSHGVSSGAGRVERRVKRNNVNESSTIVRASAAVAAPAVTQEVVDKSINAIRFLAIDGVEKANSGHPGLPMGCAPMTYVMWNEAMKHSPANPGWFNRDRFVLSAGHGSMLHYAMLHLTGYESVPIEELMQFRQWGSKTPGHPENFVTQGIEVTTGKQI